MIHIQDAKENLALYWPDFIETNGAIFLRRNFPTKGIHWTDYFDKTAAETFYNHVHLLDWFTHNAHIENDENNYWNRAHNDFKAACDVGKIVIQLWATKLKDEFPAQEFRLYFSAHDNPIIRFHTVRENESNWLSETDWAEQLANGEIVVIDTRYEKRQNTT